MEKTKVYDLGQVTIVAEKNKKKNNSSVQDLRENARYCERGNMNKILAIKSSVSRQTQILISCLNAKIE